MAKTKKWINYIVFGIVIFNSKISFSTNKYTLFKMPNKSHLLCQYCELFLRNNLHHSIFAITCIQQSKQRKAGCENDIGVTIKMKLKRKCFWKTFKCYVSVVFYETSLLSEYTFGEKKLFCTSYLKTSKQILQVQQTNSYTC